MLEMNILHRCDDGKCAKFWYAINYTDSQTYLIAAVTEDEARGHLFDHYLQHYRRGAQYAQQVLSKTKIGRIERPFERVQPFDRLKREIEDTARLLEISRRYGDRPEDAEISSDNLRIRNNEALH